MKYIKRYNESNNSSFSESKYLDYLLSEISESKIGEKLSEKNLLYIEYNDVEQSELESLEKYLKSSRFEDVVYISEYYPHYDRGPDKCYKILLVDKTFYNRNQKWLYENIIWNKHPLLIALENTDISQNLIRKNAGMATGLPDTFSMIRNLDRDGLIEFWPADQVEDPIRIYESDIIYLQFLLFKYIGK